MEVLLRNLADTKRLALLIGSQLRGGEVIELAGDVGSGKTTFTKGLAKGLGVSDDVQSPSFTISRSYEGRDGLELHHYDFYRLTNPGIMQYDIDESVNDAAAVTVVEWAESVADILPAKRTIFHFSYGSGDTERLLVINNPTTGMEEAYVAWAENR